MPCHARCGSMTNAPAQNSDVEVYINPNPNPNPNRNPNPYSALDQKPYHTHESNSVLREISMPEHTFVCSVTARCSVNTP